MKTLVALYEMFSHARQAADLLVAELGIEAGRVQLASPGAAAGVEEIFDELADLMPEEESMALGAGGGGMVAVAVENAEKETAAREILTQSGLVELAEYEGELDLAAAAEPTWLEQEPTFLRHFEAHYLPRGQTFAVYAPAYRFGYRLALGGEEATWEEVADVARRRWRAEHSGNWVQFAAAVRFAWEVVTGEPETLHEALGDEPLQTTRRGRLFQQLHDESPE